jgi:hypothetical protein
MKEKHTPGPWFVDPRYPLTIRSSIESHDPNHPGRCPIANIDLVNLGRLYGAYGNLAPVAEEAFANARLIAAAPELLAALEEVVRVYRKRELDPPKYVEQAISKARVPVRGEK